MGKNAILGVIGGLLIALSVFFSGDTATFTLDALSGGQAWVLFAAGLAVIIFVLLGSFRWAAYGAIAATTITLIKVIDGEAALSVGFIVLVVGVILSLLATVTRKSA